jgi:peroxiredoxin
MLRANRVRVSDQMRSKRTLIRCLALTVIAAAGLLFGAACAGSGGSSNEAPIPSGAQVSSFELPDVVSGQQVSLAGDIGKRDIVLVGYMGFFCPGCEQLLVELQARQGEFQSKDASLIVLGSRPESMDTARSKALSYGLTFPILYDTATTATRSVGLWSDMMDMPFMGYVIIDKSGKVVAGDQMLSEANGDAPRNVDLMLSALSQVQTAEEQPSP